MKGPQPDVNVIARRIGIPTVRWPMNCYGIAQACLKAGVVKGRLCYGVWLGPIAKKSPFKGPLARHGWVELRGGRIWDPTRWVFEARRPYIYVGPSDHYDFGANILRSVMRTGPPAPGTPTLELKMPAPAMLLVGPLLGLQPEDVEIDGRQQTYVRVNHAQAHYLATAPLQDLAEHAKPIYRALVRAGCDALIPIDNSRRVLGDERTKRRA